jgi:hypothetical protein
LPEGVAPASGSGEARLGPGAPVHDSGPAPALPLRFPVPTRSPNPRLPPAPPRLPPPGSVPPAGPREKPRPGAPFSAHTISEMARHKRISIQIERHYLHTKIVLV